MTGKYAAKNLPEDQVNYSDSLKTFWNARADSWRKTVFDPHSFYSNRTALVVNLVKKFVSAGGKSLDVGCGSGLLCYELLNRGFDVYGTDISDKMIENTVRLLQPSAGDEIAGKIKVAENSLIPFQDKFDLITAIGVFPYVADYENYLDYLSEFLADDGFIAASCTNRMSFYNFRLIVEHLQKTNRDREWKEVLINLFRTGVWSGGYVDYASSRQCYSARRFDRLFQKKGFQYIGGIDLFNIASLDTDKNSFAPNLFKKLAAKRFAWNHIGLYRRAVKRGSAVI